MNNFKKLYKDMKTSIVMHLAAPSKYFDFLLMYMYHSFYFQVKTTPVVKFEWDPVYYVGNLVILHRLNVYAAYSLRGNTYSFPLLIQCFLVKFYYFQITNNSQNKCCVIMNDYIMIYWYRTKLFDNITCRASHDNCGTLFSVCLRLIT